MEKSIRRRNSQTVKTLLAEITPAERNRIREKMTLAARLEDLVKQKGWSKGEFAQKLGKQPSEISKWLSGTHNFTMDIMSDIAFLFNLSLSELLEPRKTRVINERHYLVHLKGTTPAIKNITPVEPYSSSTTTYNCQRN